MASMIALLGLAIVGLTSYYIYRNILGSAWERGLLSIPNAHWTVPYSRCWLLWKRVNRREHSARHEAHKKYGPIVRVGPRELSVNSIEAVQTIYGGNWDKGDFYQAFENYGHHPMFSITTAKPHAERKRMLSHVYTKTFIDNSQDLSEIMNVINQDRLFPLLRTLAQEKKAVNVLPLAESYNMDATTAYIYGLNNATNWIENPKEAEVYLDAFEASLGPDTFFLLEFPMLTNILSKIGIQLVPSRVYKCFPIFLGFGLEMSQRTKKSLEEAGQPAGRTTLPVVYNHLKSKFIEANVPKEDIDNMIAAEMLDHLHAGHEATGILITYLLWEVTKDSKLQEELRNEIRSLKGSGKAPETSPLLDDLLMETMRLHPAAWGPFPRVSPPQGGQLGAYNKIPPGVSVSASPFTLGRNPEVFPEPDIWRPRRWSEASLETRKEMEKWVWGFGSGSRICIGRHLAVLGMFICNYPSTPSTGRDTSTYKQQTAMKSMLITIFEGFSTSIAKKTDMTHIEAMMALPKDKQLLLRFQPV